MESMLEDLIDLQKQKIGQCNSIEALPFKINQLNLDEEQEAEDNPIKRLVQDPGEYEGKSPKHSICNTFKETCLSGIEDKSHFQFIECDENTYSISDSSLVDTKVEIIAILDKVELDNEITDVSQEVKNICEHNQVLQEQLDKSEKRNQEESEQATQNYN